MIFSSGRSGRVPAILIWNRDILSACDCRVSVYPVDEKARLHIKQTEYTIEELLRNPSLGKRYQGGYVWVLRLCVQDYHRYIYPDNAAESGRIRIPGILHTVNPRGQRCLSDLQGKQQRVFSFENREFPYRADDGGRCSSCRKDRKPARESICETGRRKRKFCFRRLHHCADHRKNAVKPDEDILNNSREGIETRVFMGEKIGESF
mgnify:CR=1 FL=1